MGDTEQQENVDVDCGSGREETTNQKEETTTRKTKSYGISIDSSRIRAVPVDEQSYVLRNLGIDVFDQEEFEQGVLQQVDEAIAAKELESLMKSWEKDLKSVNEEIRMTLSEIDQIERILRGMEASVTSSYESRRRADGARKQRENKLKQLKKLEASQKSLYHKLGLDEEGKTAEEIIEDAPSQDAQPNILQDRLEIMKELEKEREQLIQTGKMTPFGGFVSASTSNVNEENDLTTDKDFVKDDDDDIYDDERTPVDQSPKHEVDSDEYIPDEDELRDSWQEKERSRPKLAKLKKKLSTSSLASSKHSEELDRANVVYKEDDAVELKRKKPKKSKDHFKNQSMDDGDEYLYRKRIRQERIQNLLKEQKKSDASDSDEDMPDMEFDSRLKIPGRIWHKLYKYQQTGVKWLWELHCQQAGGVVGDEMGLGKTIEAIAFLAGLKYSNVGIKKSRRGLGPVLIVCPVTVLHQWVSEFHKWAPEFRVAVLHETGTFQGHKDTLIRKICHDNGILVTGYSGVRINIDNLLAKNWDYILLDEGHKIRNPDAEITLACKQFRTPHRIILTGSPMQNNLRELWSLFDFVFPGKLGTLPVFMTEFSVPITTGGYANASDIQVQTAYKCACVLRDTINPYLLRRLKKDVKMNLDLPDKNEQVLFCRLTEEQRELYQQYLDSREVQSILAGNYKVFPGLIMLRKICNHPDLTSEAGSLLKAKQDELRTEEGLSDDPLDEDDGYGDWRRAGKMIVVESLLKMWKAQGHRVLLFSQSRQMINILETFVSSRGYTYRRMDGSTTVASRQPLVNKFNKDTSIFVFLLTTRVGGLGINLTGADRVIIYDPDWNPSTDIQARERAWRIGQTNKVTIYRLLTSGTIEEKIYHRQIFKQFLTDRVLKDPKQRRFFKTNDLYELFTLDESYKKQGTETSAIFAGTNCEIKVAGKKRRKADPRETAQPVKKSKTVAKPKFKDVKKFKDAKKPSKVHDDGGAFSIDARDIMEVSQAKKNSKEKPSQQATTTKDEEYLNNDKTCKEPDHHGNHGNSNHSNEATSEQTHQVALSKEANDCTKSKDVVPSVMDNSSSAANSTPSTAICDLLKEENNEQKADMSSKQKVLVDSQSVSSKIKQSSKDGHKKKKLKASLLSDKKLKRLLRSKKKQKKRHRKGKIDGQEISNLDYHEAYHTGTEESCTTDGEAGPHSTASQNEDVVLKTLFKKGGVHSALKHDVIMDSGNPDYTLVECEANRIAQQAVQALKKSRQQCLTARSGVPTWTGASGLSGHSAKPKPRFGKKSSANTTQDPVKVTKQSKEEPALFSGAFMGMQSSQEDSGKVSSCQLLAKMRARNNVLPEETGTSAQVSETEHDALLAEMSQFVTSGGTIRGQATTQEILDRFSTKLPRENTSVFRALLRRVCDFKRDDNRDGVWRLKNDFR